MPERKTNHESPKEIEKDPVATRHISTQATLELWVRSGGRCAMCNKFLLEEPGFEAPINLGERAHIVGWNDTPGSPRGNSPLPLDERNKVENLILLCGDHHKIADHKNTQDRFPVEQLLECKRRHEERIHHLTEMSHDRETAILRVFGAVHDSIPEMTRQLALQSVVDGNGRYGCFPMSVDRHSIEIDLTRLPEPEDTQDTTYWRLGRREIDKAAERISEFIREKRIRHLSIFALARIPLLVYLGYALDDKVPVDLYQKQRGDDEGWTWPEDEEAFQFEIAKLRSGTRGRQVALILSVSGTINVDALPTDVNDFPVYELKPAGAIPHPNLFRSRQSLDNFVRTYQDFLAELEQEDESIDTIHLFAAVPITVAIACGRSLMRHVQPELRIYDRIQNQFCPAIVINERSNYAQGER